MILGCTDAIPSTLFIFILLMTFNAAQLDAIIEQYVELCVDSMDHKDMYRFVEQTLTEDFEKLNEHELLDEIRYSFDDETLESIVNNVKDLKLYKDSNVTTYGLSEGESLSFPVKS